MRKILTMNLVIGTSLEQTELYLARVLVISTLAPIPCAASGLPSIRHLEKLL